jgi:hypothetical protein
MLHVFCRYCFLLFLMMMFVYFHLLLVFRLTFMSQMFVCVRVCMGGWVDGCACGRCSLYRVWASVRAAPISHYNSSRNARVDLVLPPHKLASSPSYKTCSRTIGTSIFCCHICRGWGCLCRFSRVSLGCCCCALGSVHAPCFRVRNDTNTGLCKTISWADATVLQ